MAMKPMKSALWHSIFLLIMVIMCVGTSFASTEKNFNDYPQIIFVAAENNRANVCMYTKSNDNHWKEVLQVQGYIGKNGIGKTCEGDGKTPIGVFGLPSAFGIQKNPGTALPYQKVTDQYYWVDDSASRYYNKMIEKDKAAADWQSGEHIVDYPAQYAYAIVIDYNKDCIKNAGSGIFLHCSTNGYTAGCVSIPTHSLIALLRQIEPGCVISIDSTDNIEKQIQSLVK